MTRHGWDDLSIHQLRPRLSGRLSPRQWRLFACACVRRLPSAARGGSGQALDLAERFADGAATAHELAAARVGGRFLPGHAAWAVCWPPDEDAEAMADRAASWVLGCLGTSAHLVSYRREEEAQARMLRDLAGPEGGPGPVDPAWLARDGGQVVRLARGIYEAKAFEQLPILGDALEDVGCADATVLAHCRHGKDHVRGCWVLDRLLGLA